MFLEILFGRNTFGDIFIPLRQMGCVPRPNMGRKFGIFSPKVITGTIDYGTQSKALGLLSAAI